LALKEREEKNICSTDAQQQEKIFHVEGIIIILNFCMRLVNRVREKNCGKNQK